MARAQVRHNVHDAGGNVIANALCHVYEEGTTTPVADLYLVETGGAAVATLTSDVQGDIVGWITTARNVDVLVTDNSDAAYYPSDPTRPLSWSQFTETVQTDLAPLTITMALARPLTASLLTQGRYLRTVPEPDSGNSIAPLARDPNHLGVNGSGRVWAVGNNLGKLGYTDDDGDTFVVVCDNPTLGLQRSIADITAVAGSRAIVSGGLAAFTQDDVNKVVSGSNVQPALIATTTIVSVAVDGSSAVLSAPCFLSNTTTFTLNLYPHVRVGPTGDVTTTVDSTTVVSASHWFLQSDVGSVVAGGGGVSLTGGYIESVQDANHATMGDAAVASGVFTMTVGSVQRIVSLVFSANFVWLVTAGNFSHEGTVWRSPLPNGSASPTFTWTRVFDLSNRVVGLGGFAPGGINSTLRNSNFSVSPDESAAFVGEYGHANRANARTTLTDGNMVANSPFLVSASGRWQATDLGSVVSVSGAGPGGASLTLTFANLLSSRVAVMNQEARTSVTNATLTFTKRCVGAAIVIGQPGSVSQRGPCIYRTDNPTAATPTWAITKMFPLGRHVHCVKVVTDGATGHVAPWATVGDAGVPVATAEAGIGSIDMCLMGTDVGLWCAQSLTGGWTERQVNGPFPGGVVRVGINFIPMVVDGQFCLVFENDNRESSGPLLYRFQKPSSNDMLVPLCHLTPGAGTMRQLTLTSGGNLYWLTTGENNNVAQVEQIWVAPPPYTVAVELERTPSFGSGSAPSSVDPFPGTFDDPVTNGDYLWLGSSRIRKERFMGQTEG